MFVAVGSVQQDDARGSEALKSPAVAGQGPDAPSAASGEDDSGRRDAEVYAGQRRLNAPKDCCPDDEQKNNTDGPLEQRPPIAQAPKHNSDYCRPDGVRQL